LATGADPHDFRRREYLKEEEKALHRFVGKVTKQLPSTTESDVQPLRALGWSDEAIFYTNTVCALFNLYNRWVTASGVHAVSHESWPHGRVLAQKAYAPRFREQHLENTNG
jgi:hypothetical protein